jgi:hypothetical protein
MKKVHLIFLILCAIIFILGCARKQVVSNVLDSPDKQALYDLMVERCAALSDTDMNRLEKIYTKDSPELEWIEKEGIPGWIHYGVTYYVHRVKRISIVGIDAAASFNLRGSTASGWPLEKDVEALFVKKGSKWKIESVGER